MVMMEVSEPEVPPPLRPPTFSAPFAAPALCWRAKKRLRCFSPDASSSLRFSPSRSPLRRLSPPLDAWAAGRCDGTSVEAPPPPPPSRQQDLSARQPGSPLPPRSPAPSDRPRFLIRLRKARRESSPRDDDGGPPPPPPPTDLSSATPTGTARGGDGEASGRTLRSSSRLAGEEEKVGKRKWRVELWVPLSRTEVEEDFLRMTGSKPPRRCRLRRRTVEPDHLSGVFPGSWLPSRITADRYNVAEPSNPGEGEI